MKNLPLFPNNMTLALIGTIIGMLVGAGVIYLVLRPQIAKREQINEEIRDSNIKAQIDLAKAEDTLSEVVGEINNATNRLQDLNSDLQHMQDQAARSAEEFYNSAKSVMVDKIALEKKELESQFQQAKEDYQKEYQIALKEAAIGFSNEISNKQILLENLNAQIATESAIVLAAVEANKRAVEMSEKAAYYKLNIPNDDLEEIQVIRECFEHLRNPEPLNKVIWKVYYEKPYTDLIGRVVGSGVHCGIYKITNLDNGMCYVGQAVNIADRWKQHIKRGMGAETPTRNKLYPAMLALGVENFSFEIIEECDRGLLNDREDYWQDFFKAKEFGYSIK